MEQTVENMKWAMEKLSRFGAWRGFPRSAEGVNAYARSFLRLVHNKTVAEIYGGKQKLEVCKVPPGMNDVTWILDYIWENLEEFPMPVVLREIYGAELPPAVVSSLAE